MWRRLAKPVKLFVVAFALAFVAFMLLCTFTAMPAVGYHRSVVYRRVKPYSVPSTDTTSPGVRDKQDTPCCVNTTERIDGPETTKTEHEVDNYGLSAGGGRRDSIGPHSASFQQLRNQLHLVHNDLGHVGRLSASASGGRITTSSASDERKRPIASDHFRPILNVAEKAALRRTFAAVTCALDAANVTYWIDSGTLLGSYRHHDFIPWDDDADLLLRSADKTRARRVLDSLLPEYRVYVDKTATSRDGNGTQDARELCWRVYATRSSSSAAASASTSSSSYGYPYVDVLFYDENVTHVWAELVAWWPKMIWPKRAVFPLLRRPIGDRLVPTPCDVTGVLATEYGGDDSDDNSDDVGRQSPFRFAKWCQSPGGRHDVRTRLTRVVVPCHVLADEHPFVHRRHDVETGSVIEFLVVNNLTVRTLTFRKECS
jgi:hypothetical protein